MQLEDAKFTCFYCLARLACCSETDPCRGGSPDDESDIPAKCLAQDARRLPTFLACTPLFLGGADGWQATLR